MPEFRFSPRPNRAAGIRWWNWGAAPFEAAAAEGRPVLLHISAVWCAASHRMDETTFSDPAVIELLNESFVPVRVDGDRLPHVQDQYIAGGWPTVAFLAPTGEVLWSGTFIEPDPFRETATGVLTAWTSRREELEAEIAKRRRALDAARRQTISLGLVRREAADDVATALRDGFDPRNGGFGDAPKFPQPEAIELLYALSRGDPTYAAMADQTLDGMLAGELWDAVEGAFFRYALNADWTAPRREKLLDANAAMLEAYATGAWLRARDDWADVAGRIVHWVDASLADARTGLWGGSRFADDDYDSADADRRRTLAVPATDSTIYTAACARWIAALALTGARLDRPDWVDRAGVALDALLAAMRTPDGGLFHYREPGEPPRIPFLLMDTLQAARAALALAQATGRDRWLREARDLAAHMERAFWAEDGAFWDRAPSDHDVGALRYRDRPFDLNAEAARLLLDLGYLTGERGWRARAERTLARLGPFAGRHGVAAAGFALALEEFFDAPPRAFIVSADPDAGNDAAGLRRAAFDLRMPGLRVWTVPPGHTVGPQRFAGDGTPAAWLMTHNGCAGPFTAAEMTAS